MEKLCKCSYLWSGCFDWNKKGIPDQGHRESTAHETP